jgi:hypothetical protein
MKIAISGTYSTGKTTLSLALSYLTGIPATRARTMREILSVTFPGYTPEQCRPSDLMELGMRRFTERIRAEIQAGNTFISDGCPLQEWTYGATRLKTRINGSPEEWKVFRQTIESFGTVIKTYVRKHYDAIIHLPVEFPSVADGHRPTGETFRSVSAQFLKSAYRELGLHPVEVRGNLHERLNAAVDLLRLKTIRSTDDAVAMAQYENNLNVIST